jgi:alpha-aminoadipate carrier protein LysW
MSSLIQQLSPTPAPAVTVTAAPAGRPECTECAAAIPASPTLPGEILDCPECGAELEVRSVTPLVLALAPDVEEDWGE